MRGKIDSLRQRKMSQAHIYDYKRFRLNAFFFRCFCYCVSSAFGFDFQAVFFAVEDRISLLVFYSFEIHFGQ